MNEPILLYRWGSSSDIELIKAFNKAGIFFLEFNEPMKDYHADSDFSMKMISFLEKNPVSAVISFDYFPLISMICQIRKIKYLSWIYDCPQLTLESKTLGYDNNYIFNFDALYTERLIKTGAKNCYHMPLGALPKKVDFTNITYEHELSFIGNLYTEDKNRIRKAIEDNLFSEYTKGFLEGIINTQKKLYGFNLVKNSLDDSIVDEVSLVCELSLGDMYRQDAYQLVADAMNMEVSARERLDVLGLLGRSYPLSLYTGSKYPDEFKKSMIKNLGMVDYSKVGDIYSKSKINLNITSKSIESGVPLRVFDVLSAGGFLITNYQPEIAELFVDGEELVMYTSYEDLLDKAEYYLEHDKERVEISHNGYKAIEDRFDLSKQVVSLISLC